MSALDQVKAAMSEACETEKQSILVHTVAQALMDGGTPMLLIALPSDLPLPMFYSNIRVDQVGHATLVQVITQVLTAIGIKGEQASLWAAAGATAALRGLAAHQQRQAMRQQAAAAAQRGGVRR